MLARDLRQPKEVATMKDDGSQTTRVGGAGRSSGCPGLCDSFGDPVAVSRRWEEACARFEGTVRALKEDVRGCLDRQHELHATYGAVKDHIKMVDGIAAGTAHQMTVLTKALDAYRTVLDATLERLAVLEQWHAEYRGEQPKS
jgi:hypothetical protein